RTASTTRSWIPTGRCPSRSGRTCASGSGWDDRRRRPTMSALNPWFLLAAASVAVPLFLHRVQRRRTRRVSFPALRYLERTEREHARRIRLRQILLLLVRVSILLFVVGAGARLVFFGDSGAHPPTAVVLVLDNSMSSGRIVSDRRVLD